MTGCIDGKWSQDAPSIGRMQEDQALYKVFAGWSRQCTRVSTLPKRTPHYQNVPGRSRLPFPLPVAPAALNLMQVHPPLAPVRSGELCRKYNENWCFYRQCKHTHACSMCYGTHPAEVCTINRRGDPSPRRDTKPTGLF